MSWEGGCELMTALTLSLLLQLLLLRIADKSWRTLSYSQDCGLEAEIFVLAMRSLHSRLRIGCLRQPPFGRPLTLLD